MESFSYTGQDIADDVRTQFGDVDGFRLDDKKLLRWINNGQRDIIATSPVLERHSTTNLLAGQSAYKLGQNFSAEEVQNWSSVMVRGRSLEVMTWAAFQRFITSTDRNGKQADFPSIGAVYGDTIHLWPTPTESVPAGIDFYFTVWPIDLETLSDDLKVPNRYRNALVTYVLASATEMDADHETAAALEQKHQQQVAREFERGSISPTEHYPFIDMTGMDEEW